MDTINLFSFLSASVLLTLMPGPDNIFVLTESVTKSKRDGIIIAGGLASGIIVHTLIVATGLAVLLQQYDWLFFGVKMAGVGYLLYLTYLSYKETTTTVDILTNNEINEPKQSFGQLYQKGVLMNVLNPKVTLFFIAFLPQFVTKGGYAFEWQIILLGALFMIQAFVLFSLIAVVGNRIGSWLKSEQFWHYVRWTKIIVMGGLALLLVIN